MARRTKIIATIGPASDDPGVLRGMIDAGADIIRIGLAHGTLAEAIARYRHVRQVAREAERTVGTLIDLPGPKVRLAQFADGGADLATGTTVLLRPGAPASTQAVLGVDYAELLEDVKLGDKLALGDGTVRCEIVDLGHDQATVRITHGGRLQGRPGLHVPADRLGLATPTAEDLYKLDAFVEEGADMVALSFVRSAHDVRRVGTEPAPRGPLVIAKIETRAAVENLDGIIAASGAVMVARGDLGIELGIEELPTLQKRIIRGCVALGRPVITATQMLESMITAATPTRAEVSDVANAVFDGTSALMLSAETAVGIDPVGAVQTMARVSERADREFDYDNWARRLRATRRTDDVDADDRVTDAMTGAAWRAATEMGATAIICISDTGFTVRSIARFRPSMPILGFTPDERTQHQLTLSWGTQPLLGGSMADSLEMMWSLVQTARERGLIRSGDVVAVLAGAGQGSRAKATDLLRLVRVP
ncbi:MAG: pyruvate kinase [Microthrixaceae bacterium]|jgi:pyruvate kinase|nr:pyruvate kinase [Actinomycetota bacterium]MBP6728995.1 pyruvate kinase [Microthrixaceae bacterium]HMS13261.1 pyruvate kinase [Microthrixaceae bacterium]HMT23406.1 pyruvate kinase [Microthrixaceae bacterium]